jgi:hypothetical protein
MDAARKVLRTDDPEAKLHELIDKGLRSPTVRHVLREGHRALARAEGRVWVAGVDRAKPGYVVLVAAKDTEKAQATLDKSAKSEKARQGAFLQGRRLPGRLDGVAAGIVGDFLTVGTSRSSSARWSRGRRLARRRESASRARSTTSTTTASGASTSI